MPFSKGYLLNWDIQRQVWDYVFRTKLKLNFDSKRRYSNMGLIITEPAFNFPPLQETMLEVLFEEYGFGRILVLSAAQLAAFRYLYEQNVVHFESGKREKQIACLAVDSGFSFTHVVPFVEGYKITAHMKRIDVGGKVLTNYLKEIISYRQINVLDETYVVNQMKEDCCFASTDFWNDLKVAKQRPPANTIIRDYILPDYITFKRGFIYDRSRHQDLVTADHQKIVMNNERFQVAEILFNPGDVNIEQVGISNTILYSVSEFSPNYRAPELKNGIEFSVPMSRERPDNLREIDSDEDYIEEEEEEVQLPSSSKKHNGTDKPAAKVDLSKFNDENIQSHLFNNIVLIGKSRISLLTPCFHGFGFLGGNFFFKNIRNRIYNDVRSNVADILDLRVTLPSDPIAYAWLGGKSLCSLTDTGVASAELSETLFFKYAISRTEYKKHGLQYCMEKMGRIQLPTFT